MSWSTQDQKFSELMFANRKERIEDALCELCVLCG